VFILLYIFYSPNPSALIEWGISTHCSIALAKGEPVVTSFMHLAAQQPSRQKTRKIELIY
jgi:hypothetical protein